MKKIPARGTLEKILQRHREQRVRLTRPASSFLVLYHWIFLKKLAKTCDNLAFRHGKVKIDEDVVRQCAPEVLFTFNEYEKVRRRRLRNMALAKKSHKGDSKDISIYDMPEEDSVMRKK